MFIRHRLSAVTLLLISLLACSPLPRPKSRGGKPGRASLDAPPTPDERAFLIARSRFGHKHYSEAAAELERFLAAYPRSQYRPRVLQMLALVYLKAGDCPRALEVFQRFSEEAPQEVSETLRWQMAECYFTSGDYQQALAQYQLLLDRRTKTVPRERLLYKMGLAAYRLGWLQQAREELAKIGGYSLTIVEQIELFLTRGKIALRLQDYRNAWRLPLHALEIAEAQSSLQTIQPAAQARDFLRRTISTPLPAGELERIATTYPDRFPGGEAIWQLIQLRENEPRQALELLERFLHNFPTNHPRYRQAQQLHQRLKEELRVDRRKIGVIIPFSGKLAPFGQKVLHGIELAVEEENRRREKKMALIIKDSQGNSLLAERQMRELVQKERVIAVIGPVLSKAALAAARVANELQTPMLTPTAGAEGIPETGPYVFRNSLTAQQQVESLVRFAVEKMGLRRFAILAPENAYGQEMADIFAVLVESDYEQRLLAQLSYPPESTDFRAQIQTLHTLPIQAVFLPDYYDKIVQIAPQIAFYSPEGKEGALQRLIERFSAPAEDELVPARLLQWRPQRFFFQARGPSKPGLESPGKDEFPILEGFPPKIFLLGTNGWYDPQLIREGDKFVEESVFACGFFAQSEAPAVKNFVERFRRRFLEEPDILAAQAYDSANILLSVLRRGAKTRQEVQEALSSLEDFSGLTGRGRFDGDGEMQKELAMVGIKKRRFRLLSGDEEWLHVLAGPRWGVLLSEKDLEQLLPWDFYYAMAPLELFAPQTLSAALSPPKF